MKKIEKVIYVADDGKEFANESDCKKYEETAEIRSCILKLSEYCKNSECNSSECIFSSKNGCLLVDTHPVNWDIIFK